MELHLWLAAAAQSFSFWHWKLGATVGKNTLYYIANISKSYQGAAWPPPTSECRVLEHDEGGGDQQQVEECLNMFCHITMPCAILLCHITLPHHHIIFAQMQRKSWVSCESSRVSLRDGRRVQRPRPGWRWPLARILAGSAASKTSLVTGSTWRGGPQSCLWTKTPRPSCLETLPCPGRISVKLLVLFSNYLCTFWKWAKEPFPAGLGLQQLLSWGLWWTFLQVTAGRTQPTAELPSPLARWSSRCCFQTHPYYITTINSFFALNLIGFRPLVTSFCRKPSQGSMARIASAEDVRLEDGSSFSTVVWAEKSMPS